MRSDSPAMLMLDGVRFGFDDRPDFLGPITLSLRKRECWGIVGPNGAGKSTLLPTSVVNEWSERTFAACRKENCFSVSGRLSGGGILVS